MIHHAAPCGGACAHWGSHLWDVLLLQQPDAWCLWLVWELVQLECPGHGHARLQQANTALLVPLAIF